jgi:hypothetical protein
MTKEEADIKLRQIEELAREIELDKVLFKIDKRYSMTVMWIDTDIENAS